MDPRPPQRAVLWFQAAGLAGAAVVLAAASNVVRPDPLPWTQAWSERWEARALDLGLRLAGSDEVRALLDGGEHLVFDARPAMDFERGHLPGAFSLPSEAYDDRIEEYLPLLFPEQPLVVYCSGEACDESLLVSQRLAEMGFTNIVLFTGGTAAWEEAGFELVEGM